MIKIIITDEVYCTVEGLSKTEKDFFYNTFGVFKEGYFFNPMYKIGRWDGKIRFFDKVKNRTFVRLLTDIIPVIESWGHDIELQDLRRGLPISFEVTKDYFNNPDIIIRPYQVQAIQAALDNMNGFLEMATGAGKTICCAVLCDLFEKHDLPTYLIVPSTDLVTQTAKLFDLVGVNYGIYSGANKDSSKAVTICTWQALQHNPMVISDAKAIIIDEAHGAKAEVVEKLLNQYAPNAHYRLGFTGTMPKPAADKMQLRCSIGDVLIQVTAAFLIENGYLSKLEIQPIEIDEGVKENFPDYASEKSFTIGNKERLDFIADYIIAKSLQYGNTLVLVHNIKQGKLLNSLIKDSIFLYGSTENDVREEWYSTFADRNDLIVIATYGIAKQGISIDRVFHLVLIDAGKSFITAIQSIGRGLRKNGDKNYVFVSDIYSKLKYSKEHMKKRLKYYKEALYPVLKKLSILCSKDK